MVEPLILFQRLAALGSELHGKKVVITLSPDFVMSRISSRNAFAYNFSPLHAYETVFSSDLSLAWKVDAARRLVGYPETIQKYPVLNFALQNLADGSPLALAQYYAALPLGQVQCWILQLQDHWATLSYINRHPELESTVPHKTKTLKWDTLLDSAQNQYDSISNNNPFGFSNDNWNTVYHGQTPPDQVDWGDQTFLGYLKKAQGWTDLALLLRALKELGAEPLVLSAPLSGAYFDFVGISPQARNAYYDKLQATVEPYDVYLLDFRDHDEDKEFLMDARFHLSGPGWVYYSETIDAFYHGTLGVGR
jgi:D-alanine transfer protein